MTKPLKGGIPAAETTPTDTEIVLGDPNSGPVVRFGPYKAHPDGKRSALTVLGDYLVRRGIISPAAH